LGENEDSTPLDIQKAVLYGNQMCVPGMWKLPHSNTQAFIFLFTLAHINHKMQIFTILFVCKLPGAGTLNPVTQTPHFLCCRNSNRKYRRHINENALGIIRSTLNSGGFGPQAPNMNKELGIPSNAGPMNQLAAGYQRPLTMCDTAE